MSFETYAAAITFLAIPLLLLFTFIRGVPTPNRRAIRRTERPFSFWVILALWVAFLWAVAALLWAQDERGFQLFSLLAIVFALIPAFRSIVQAGRSGRISGTTRIAQPAAYWSAMFGISLFLVLMTAFTIYVVIRMLPP